MLDRYALNRATLSRQLLLRREELATLTAVQRLAGLNAQLSEPPYIALWTRLHSFRHEYLEALIRSRQVVRAGLMRSTQHLVTADDLLMLRPLLEPVLQRAQRSAFGRRTTGVAPSALAESASELLHGRTLTRSELGELLAQQWPGYEPSALAWSAQYLAPVLHPPPAGLWETRTRDTHVALIQDWLGSSPAEVGVPSELIRRYLGAFGPATLQDMQAWSGLTRLNEALDAVRPSLCIFQNEDGKDLFDLPNAPRPEPDTPAPPRFLPAFDNLVLAYADRRRVMSIDHQRRVCVGAKVAPTVLVDGFVLGTWSTERTPSKVTLCVHLFDRVHQHDHTAILDEGQSLLTFLAASSVEKEIAITGTDTGA